MDAELQKIRDAEQEKIDAVEMLKRKLHDERMDRERHLHEYKAQARDAIASKQEAEHMLRRAQDEGQRMVDNERRRLEREQRFRKSHEEQVMSPLSSLITLTLASTFYRPYPTHPSPPFLGGAGCMTVTSPSPRFPLSLFP